MTNCCIILKDPVLGLMTTMRRGSADRIPGKIMALTRCRLCPKDIEQSRLRYAVSLCSPSDGRELRSVDRMTDEEQQTRAGDDAGRVMGGEAGGSSDGDGQIR